MTNASCALIFVGLGGIVALDGSPAGRVVRLLAVGAACISVVLLHRTRARRGAAIGSIALGIVAATVGATIAFSHLTTTGLSVEVMSALIALTGGLLAVGASGWRLVRGAHGWRRLLAVPIVLVVGYVVVAPVALAVYATNVPRPELGSATPASRGLPYVNASFLTNDGVRLSGWYIPSRNRAAVVLLHGASSTRSNVLSQAAVLARAGYGVLLFDARGHGRSSGRAMEFGWYGEEDAAAAVTYLRGRPDVDDRRIGAVGMSMGGEEAIGAMAHDSRIRATVAEGATNRVFADKAWIAAEYGIRGRVQQGVEWLTYTLADLLTAASPPISLRAAVAAAAPRPVLLIAAGRVEDERLADETIEASSPATVEVWVVPGAGHTGGLRTRPREWAQRVTRFLDRALLTSRADA